MASTSLGVIAQANTSTYIVGGLDTYLTPVSGGVRVECYFYYKRTNTYAGSTYSSSTDVVITIDGSTTSANIEPLIPGYNNAWIGPYVYASKTFTSGGDITISWSATDNAGAYFGGSGSTTITVPSAPTGLTRSNTVISPTSVSATLSITSWGVGGTQADRYLELSVVNAELTKRNYKRAYIGTSTSANITVDNSATSEPTTHKEITIGPNDHYYLVEYATNGAMGSLTTNQSIYTPCNAPTVTKGDATDTTQPFTFAAPAGNGALATVFRYRYKANGGSFGDWVYAARNATSGSVTITGLTANTSYTMESQVITTTSTAAPYTVTTTSSTTTTTFTTTETPRKAYGSVGGQTKRAAKIYGSVANKSKLVVKVYGSKNGLTKRIY